MILVDSSVWIDHLRSSLAPLVTRLESTQVLGHPFVTGELALGNLRDRDRTLTALQQLPQAPTATHDEVLYLIEQHQLQGRGIGWVDAHLLASTKLAGDARLWTHDKRLYTLAEALGLAQS